MSAIEKNLYYIKILTDNNGKAHETSIPLTITLLDENDNIPEFTSYIYQYRVQEGTTSLTTEYPIYVSIVSYIKILAPKCIGLRILMCGVNDHYRSHGKKLSKIHRMVNNIVVKCCTQCFTDYNWFYINHAWFSLLLHSKITLENWKFH